MVENSQMLIERELLEDVQRVLGRREIIAIRGPRQSGKTTFLKEILMNYLLKDEKIKKEDVFYVTFEDKEVLEKFSLNPKEFVKAIYPKPRLIFIDEFHYHRDGRSLKMLFDLFDDIKFIISGSSSLELTLKTGKYLVGRIFYFDLLNLSFFEFLNFKNKGIAKYYREVNGEVKKSIFEGGGAPLIEKDIFVKDLLRYLEEYLIYGAYPEVVKSEPGIKRIILKNILETYLLRDVRDLLAEDVFKFRRIATYLASNLGSILNYNELASYSSTYYKYIVKVMDILEETYIIKLLRPFYSKITTELRKSPKIYFFDFGLRNYLVNNFNELDRRGDASFLVENFVLNQLGRYVEKINYWRTKTKSEVDFILDLVSEQIPVEVKFKSFIKPRISPPLRSFIKKYKPDFAIVFTKDFWGEVKLEGCIIKFIPVVYA
jgi:predicted AAA+ superfamily ATPase